MDKDELLAKSGIQGNYLPNFGIDLKIHPMDYLFLLRVGFLPNDKRERNFEDFKDHILNLVCRYIVKWISIEKKDVGKDIAAAFYFQSKTDFQTVFNQIFDDRDHSAEMFIQVSNTNLGMKRFGNCLGLEMTSNNSGSEVHEHGTKILESFCRERGEVYLSEFIHSIECIIPLPGQMSSHDAKMVNFSDVLAFLRKACPYFEWVKPDKFMVIILDAYTHPLKEDLISVATWEETGIFCKLVHKDQSNDQSSAQWRIGNIENMGGDSWRSFTYHHDLCLAVGISSPFPRCSFLREIDPSLDTDKQQKRLIEAGAIIYSQLSAAVAAYGVQYQ